RAQVDGHAALATVVDDPRVIEGAGRVAGAAHAVHVARRRLHLDDVGTEVRHHRGRDGTGDEIRRVDRADALEEARHGPTSWGAPYHEPRGGLTGGFGRDHSDGGVRDMKGLNTAVTLGLATALALTAALLPTEH